MADAYEITGQVERSVLGPDGRPFVAVVVTFRTKPSAAVGTVDVPKGEYSAEKVDAMIGPYAAELERTRAL